MPSVVQMVSQSSGMGMNPHPPQQVRTNGLHKVRMLLRARYKCQYQARDGIRGLIDAPVKLQKISSFWALAIWGCSLLRQRLLAQGSMLSGNTSDVFLLALGCVECPASFALTDEYLVIEFGEGGISSK